MNETDSHGIVSAGVADPGGAASADELAAWAELAALRAQLAQACGEGRPVLLQGGNTKAFYGNPWPVDGADPVVVDARRYRGIVSYEPTELVVTVRGGTPLAELETLLAAQGQCLAFEPPRFAAGGTVGGMVAAGLSGPRRMSAGAVRDFVLGTVLVSARGELMRFGGQVMKNVAGYDISRLLVGSMGVLGMLAEVSLKVLPLPRADQTLRLPLDEAEAIRRCNQWGGQPLPLAATAWVAGALWVRLCGAGRAVEAALSQLGGDPVPAAEAARFWQGLRDQQHAFFGEDERAAPLWRLSVPATTPPLALPGRQLIEWGGALRWYRPEPEQALSPEALRSLAAEVGGSAVLFRAGRAQAQVLRLPPLAEPARGLHQRLKQVFDPGGHINPGRLYDWL